MIRAAIGSVLLTAAVAAAAWFPIPPAQPLLWSASAASPLQPGVGFRDCEECPEMVVISAGRFTMGSPGDEQGRFPDEGPQHAVTIADAFAVGRFEVTRAEFAAFADATARSTGSGCWSDRMTPGEWLDTPGVTWRDPGFPQSDRDPVVCVSWDDAHAYSDWLSARTGKRYRLLSEAEWEYAARAGTLTSRHWGERADFVCLYANGADRTARTTYRNWVVMECDDRALNTAPVGSYRANGFGLHDMLGNVWEWTEDCWIANYEGAPGDGRPRLAGDCDRRVLRGGSWFVNAQLLRSAVRSRNFPSNRNGNTGFRVARAL